MIFSPIVSVPRIFIVLLVFAFLENKFIFWIFFFIKNYLSSWENVLLVIRVPPWSRVSKWELKL